MATEPTHAQLSGEERHILEAGLRAYVRQTREQAQAYRAMAEHSPTFRDSHIETAKKLEALREFARALEARIASAQAVLLAEVAHGN